MHHLLSILPCLLLSSSAVSAAAIPDSRPLVKLDNSHIILYGLNGRMEVANKTEYLAKRTLPIDPTGPLVPSVPSESKRSKLSERCDSTSIFSENADTSFIGWDVAMSSVVNAKGSADTTVAVTSGYQVANSLTVSQSVDLTIVKDFLSASTGLSYTEMWTSTYDSGYTFTVDEGSYGVVVSNPETLRKSGSVAIGCVGSAETVTYQADSFSSKTYGGLDWVLGTISLCQGTTYPVPMCLGSGTLS